MSNVTNMLRGVKKAQDEWYTPDYAVKALLPYLPEESRILCPFDTQQSAFVRVLSEAGHRVGWQHINFPDDAPGFNGDFFNISVDRAKNYDFIISNPPYSKKDAVFEKLFALGRPFAMLMGSVAGMFEGKRFPLFSTHSDGLSMIWLYPRVAYIDQQGVAVKSPPFQSAYVTWNISRRGHWFQRLEK